MKLANLLLTVTKGNPFTAYEFALSFPNNAEAVAYLDALMAADNAADGIVEED
jgi:hypothetical protein